MPRTGENRTARRYPAYEIWQELAVREIVHGLVLKNKAALANSGHSTSTATCRSRSVKDLSQRAEGNS
ncbi:acetoacetate--CoA ligase family protein [Phyllobacterium sophorae]|uniref:acetoacetate--CoA ligase family protein n=1 Tax=Phyllobacterium sophorae TaxID=1520277 RepID=UPI0011B244FE